MKNCQSCVWAQKEKQAGGFGVPAVFIRGCSLRRDEVNEVIHSASAKQNECICHDTSLVE